MSIGIPNELDCRKSDKRPLDLLREAIVSIDRLAAQYGMLASNQSIIEIYALLDGAKYKLENIDEPIKAHFDKDDDTPLDGVGVAKVIWNMMTKE